MEINKESLLKYLDLNRVRISFTMDSHRITCIEDIQKLLLESKGNCIIVGFTYSDKDFRITYKHGAKPLVQVPLEYYNDTDIQTVIHELSKLSQG